MPNKDHDYLFKVLIIGDYGVGKVDILQTILKDNTNQQPKGARIDFAVKTVVIKNKRIKLQIWDTAGQFCSISSEYYKGASGILLVYDITNSKSFENLAKWLTNIEENVHRDAKIIILGNRFEFWVFVMLGGHSRQSKLCKKKGNFVIIIDLT